MKKTLLLMTALIACGAFAQETAPAELYLVSITAREVGTHTSVILAAPKMVVSPGGDLSMQIGTEASGTFEGLKFDGTIHGKQLTLDAVVALGSNHPALNGTFACPVTPGVTQTFRGPEVTVTRTVTSHGFFSFLPLIGDWFVSQEEETGTATIELDITVTPHTAG